MLDASVCRYLHVGGYTYDVMHYNSLNLQFRSFTVVCVFSHRNKKLEIYFVSPLVVIPRERGYCFRFVCLSVRLSGTLFFLFCARNSSYSFHHTQTKPIPSESWVSGVCHGGGSVFSYPPKFRRNRSLKTAQNHKFQFLERQKSKSFRPRDAIPIPYESPPSVV